MPTQGILLPLEGYIEDYKRVEDNTRAIAKTIEAMRAIERHGASQLLEREPHFSKILAAFR